MTRKKMKIMMAVLLGALLLGACAGKEEKGRPQTPKEAAQCAMESLKSLDLETFNSCTDNYVKTYRNLLGIPTGKEYHVFQELQQPGLIKGKRYETDYRIAQKLVEHMTWEIKEIEEKDGRAEIVMEITNLDLTELTGNFIVALLEEMVEDQGTGISQMLKKTKDLAWGKEGLLEMLDDWKEEDICTIWVEVLAYREDGQWKLHLSEEFIDAIMGNTHGDEFSEETKQRIQELEEEYEKKMEAWGEAFGEKVEDWAREHFE